MDKLVEFYCDYQRDINIAVIAAVIGVVIGWVLPKLFGMPISLFGWFRRRSKRKRFRNRVISNLKQERNNVDNILQYIRSLHLALKNDSDTNTIGYPSVSGDPDLYTDLTTEEYTLAFTKSELSRLGYIYQKVKECVWRNTILEMLRRFKSTGNHNKVTSNYLMGNLTKPSTNGSAYAESQFMVVIANLAGKCDSLKREIDSFLKDAK
ncbi:hypothetical protein D770_06755 [Flammeovirgaceae bacterium 311]|nr:hypothetical protein D770_06755 [Flammeovirgaceae bacterium 311]